ncbi:MAG: VOC family protein [Rhodospirillales bacterium]|nr:VOC family protein [Rhodospirillales bacterium]
MVGKIKPQLTHFALFTTDLAKMEDFYTRVMGLTVTDRGGASSAPVEMIFMSSSPDEHHQFVLLSGRPDDVDFRLNQQMSFLVESLDELREMRDAALEAGMENMREATHGNAWSIYFDDPEQNMVEIYVHTPWYIRQPHLVPIDLDKSDDEIYAETEAHCREQDGFMMAEERRSEMARMIG